MRKCYSLLNTFNGLLLFCAVLNFSGSTSLYADEIYIAAASNFTETLKQLGKQFEAQTDHKVIMAFASTGKQYAQIIHGAPFDIFFAADSKRPKLLEDQGIAIPKSRFTYAVGKLVLWSPQSDLVNADLIDKNAKILGSMKFNYLSIANPKLAPYGRASQEVLEAHKQWDDLQNRLVRGENIGQAFQFIKSANAELGFIAYSQIKRPKQAIAGSFWIPPESLYKPMNQQAVLLKDKPAVRQFLNFLKSDEAQKIIQSYGYGLANAD